MTSFSFVRLPAVLFRTAALMIAMTMLIAQSHVAFADSNDRVATKSPVTAAPSVEGYTLGAGDKVRVIVFGEQDLGGEFVVDDGGFLSLPLIGQLSAAGRTLRQLESDIAAKLGAQYLKDPRVSIEVINYRPFYILGEVNKPGEYPYVANMSVLQAIALAGGYTYRANESSVYIKRKGSKDEVKYPADDTTKLLPGDVVNIEERWF